MKTFLRLAVLLSSFALLSPAIARDHGQPVFRVKIDLRDGTRVIGQCENDTFKFTSALLGDIRLSPGQVSQLEAQAGTNLVKLTSVGGDVLTVQLAMEELKVKTSFGKVEIPVNQIRSVRVSVLGQPGRPTDGLIALWHGNGNGGDSVGDNPGQLQNVSFVEGVSGQAFSFYPDSFPYGTYTGVKISDRPEYALTRALTIEGWVRPRGDGYVIFFRGDHRPGLDPYYLSMQHNHAVRFGICDEQGGDAFVETEIPYGRWTHIAATLDGDSGTLNLYTNGQLSVSTPTSIRPFGPLQSNQWPGIGIGNVNDGGNNFPFTGDLDEISLYDRALSPAEIQGLYEVNAANADQKPAELFPPRGASGIPPMRMRIPPGIHFNAD